MPCELESNRLLTKFPELPRELRAKSHAPLRSPQWRWDSTIPMQIAALGGKRRGQGWQY
jgi:hypothetical protein